MSNVFVSIGSNIEPARYVRAALVEIKQRFAAVRISTVYRTKPVGFDGADFLNLVVAFTTRDSVHGVSEALNDIERANGRQPGAPRFAARTLDLDLLLYDDLIINEPGLRLPRAEILDYAFVLKPLAELAGDARHPVTGRIFADHWQSFVSTEAPPVAVKL